jgi:hypothetical protein
VVSGTRRVEDSRLGCGPLEPLAGGEKEIVEKLKGPSFLLVTYVDKNDRWCRVRVRIQTRGQRAPYITYKILRPNYFAEKGKLEFYQAVPCLKSDGFVLERLHVRDEGDLAQAKAKVKEFLEGSGLKILDMQLGAW